MQAIQLIACGQRLNVVLEYLKLKAERWEEGREGIKEITHFTPLFIVNALSKNALLVLMCDFNFIVKCKKNRQNIQMVIKIKHVR